MDACVFQLCQLAAYRQGPAPTTALSLTSTRPALTNVDIPSQVGPSTILRHHTSSFCVHITMTPLIYYRFIFITNYNLFISKKVLKFQEVMVVLDTLHTIYIEVYVFYYFFLMTFDEINTRVQFCIFSQKKFYLVYYYFTFFIRVTVQNNVQFVL